MPERPKPQVNGEDVRLHYGDIVEPLPDHLIRQDREIRFLRMAVIGFAILFGAHMLGVPTEQIFPFLIHLLGL